MATEFQQKREQFSELVGQIKTDNMEFFRGKTLSKVFIIGKSRDDLPALLFPKGIPDEIQDKLNDAFKEVFGENL